MGDEWQEYTINEVGKVITGKTPKGTLDKYFGGDTLFVTPTDMLGDKYIRKTSRTLSEDGADKQKKVVFDRGIIVSCIGWQMGKSAIVNQRASTNQQINTIILNESLVDIDYLYYVLKEKREEIFNLGATATRTPIVKKSLFEKISFQAPTLYSQKKIANYLSVMDDKIELNRQMNATLEAMAQALFKSWFVDFDPVIDNALTGGKEIPEALSEKAQARAALGDKRRPLPEEIRALFPDEFTYSGELGWIPKGWECIQWGKIAKLEYGKSLKGYRDGKGTIPVFGTNGQIGLTDKALCNKEGIIIGRKGAYRGVHYSSVPFFVIDTAFYLAPIAPLSDKWAYYEILRFDINGMDSGSAIPSTSRDDFYRLWSTIPAPIVQTEFDRIVSSIYEKKNSNNTTNSFLAELRATLLPKLLSGELRIPDAEKMVEDLAL